MTENLNDSITFSGPLKKRNNRSKLSVWSSCFCKLADSKMIVFKNQSSTKPDQEIPITSTTEIKVSQKDKSHRFTITNTDGTSMSFTSDDSAIVCQWVLMFRSLSYQSNNLSMDSFEIISVIGRGFYGKVMLCKLKKTGEQYAVKTVHKNKLIQSKKIYTILRERDIMAKAKNTFLVNLHYAFQTDTKFYLVLEYVPGGELYRLIHGKKKQKLPFQQIQLYIAEIAYALEYLHSIGIVYRDLKPENILINKDGHIKLADFGLSKDIFVESTTATFCGTPEYVAPELVKREQYSFSIDWWALGILTYELLYGEVPFLCENRASLFNKIMYERPDFPIGTEAVHRSFILALLEKDPNDRATFATLRNHQFWNGLNLDDVKELRTTPIYIPSSKTEDNFDPAFTKEDPLDSISTPVSGQFKGFSFNEMDHEPTSTEEMAPSILSVGTIES
ncbi:Serine/threonine-protein kinase Sgk2 [Tritrichomonas foetus]|uniref:Serine/threonine-protein kinase Sgk2 n=1 Tax=Tritrichomonas foetus TaxID=1144522 RepID=A0A1J4JN31_9EUKA|nr:Serine/threonine-protein kinase Sgk2 [Tritrichomonas foetus]|eukprot:OHT00535.1 Serine/threonine-protein kinase Sgk2 [Tritrichomonas foetus]